MNYVPLRECWLLRETWWQVCSDCGTCCCQLNLPTVVFLCCNCVTDLCHVVSHETISSATDRDIANARSSTHDRGRKYVAAYLRTGRLQCLIEERPKKRRQCLGPVGSWRVPSGSTHCRHRHDGRSGRGARCPTKQGAVGVTSDGSQASWRLNDQEGSGALNGTSVRILANFRRVAQPPSNVLIR